MFKLTIIPIFFFHLNSLTEAGDGGRLLIVFSVTCLFYLFVFSVCFGSKSVFNQFMWTEQIRRRAAINESNLDFKTNVLFYQLS